MEKRKVVSVGIHQRRAGITKIQDVQQPMDLPSIHLSGKEYCSLRNGMQNLDADIESALFQVDDALMSSLEIADLPEDYIVRLTCLKKLLNKSLHSIRDWRIALLK